MKHKLKLSFWALGILVLIVSQLFVLAPAPKAYAASLSLDTINDETYKFSVYAAWHSCLTYFDIKATLTDSLDMDTNQTHFVGFAGTGDGNNNDGLVSCAEAGKLWMAVAGYSDAAAMLSDLGFQKGTKQSCSTTGTSGQQTCVDTWTLGGKNRNDVLNKHSELAKSKNIPTSVPTWGRYTLAITALQAKCQPSSTTGSAGTRAGPTTTVTYVSDNIGTLSTKQFATGTNNTIAAWPGPSGGNWASCDYLIGEVNNSKTGANALSNAMAEERISTALGTAETTICNDKLGLETDRQKDECKAKFSKYLNECVDKYYKGNAMSGSISRTQPFDNTVVSICVEDLAKKGGYTISAEDIAGVLGDAQDAATPDTSAGSNTDADICDILGEDVPMKWMACAILTATNGIVEALYNLIQDMLYTPVTEILGNTNYQSTINTFRLLGMAIVFIAGLVMVIAQATGSELVDAYTVRKVLPRLGIAVIGIAIAVPLMKFAITLVNDIGIGMGDFVTTITPEKISGTAVESSAAGAVVGGLTLGAIGSFTAVIAAVIVGPAALTYIVVALVALLIAFVTLAMRQLIIVVLILFAPLAIAASVLPGTDKLWKFWRTTFITTLMMFPIIMLFLKSGVLMAYIFGSIGDQQGNALYYLLAAIVFIAPYFMVPLAFKMAGGLIGNVFGMINDRSKGLFDRMRNMRGNAMKKNWQNLRAGNRYKGSTRLGNAINRAGEVTDAFASGEMGFDTAQWKDQYKSARSRKSIDQAREALQNNRFIKGISANDDYSTAALEHWQDANGQRKYLQSVTDDKGNRAYDDATIEEALGSIRTAQRSVSKETFENAMLLSLPSTGTAWKRRLNKQTGRWEGGAGAMREEINRTVGNDRNRYATLLASMRSAADQASRPDLAGGSFGDDLAQGNKMYEEYVRTGTFEAQDAKGNATGNTMSTEGIQEYLIEKAFDSKTPGQIAMARGHALESFIPVMQKKLDAIRQAPDFADNPAKQRELKQQLASYAGLLDASGQIKPENARILADKLFNLDVGGAKISDMIASFRDDPEFGQMRREYATRTTDSADAFARQQTMMQKIIDGGGAFPQEPLFS